MARNLQILYISYDGMTDPLGQSQVLPYIEGLTKYGYEFTIISCEKAVAYQQNKEVVEAICRRSNIDWHPLPYTKSPPVISTYRDIIAMGKKAKELHLIKHFDLFHCRSYMAPIIALQLKKKYGLQFLFDMRGLWADERIDGGQWNIKNPIYKIVYKYFKFKEKQFLEEAAYTVSLTEAAKQEIHKWRHIKNNPVKIDVIPCCADTDLFNRNNITETQRKEWQIKLGINPDEFILSYLGGIGLWYMLSEMLDFYKVLSVRIPNAKFLFITPDDPTDLKEAAIKKNIPLDKIIILKAMRKDVPALISLSSASVFFIRPTYSKMSSSPTKQGEIMSMGIPVFCNSGIGDTDLIINKYQSGILINNFSDSDYEKAVFTFNNHSFDANLIREGALDYFNLNQGITKYLSIYKTLLNT